MSDLLYAPMPCQIFDRKTWDLIFSILFEYLISSVNYFVSFFVEKCYIKHLTAQPYSGWCRKATWLMTDLMLRMSKLGIYLG